MSFYIVKDTRRHTIRADTSLVVPIYNNNFPPNIEHGIGGGILYNLADKLPYYNDGSQWLPFGGGGGGSTVKTYSLILSDGSEPLIPTNTNFNGAGEWLNSPQPWHDQTGAWNLVGGYYTATFNQTLMVSANLTWLAGGSTIGKRYLRVMYKPLLGPEVIAKEAVTQPDPNQDIATTQEATITLKLSPGDMVYLQVYQDSGVDMFIKGGTETSMTGFSTTI